MFLILFVVACLTQLPQDTEVPCDPEPVVLHQGSTAFCSSPYLDVVVHLDSDLDVNRTMFYAADQKKYVDINFAYYDEVYDTNVFHISYEYTDTCSDFSSIEVKAYLISDNPYDFTLYLNAPNSQE